MADVGKQPNNWPHRKAHTSRELGGWDNPILSWIADLSLRRPVLVVMVSVIVFVLVSVLVLNEVVGPAKAHREHGLYLIDTELRMLPPFPGSQAVQTIRFDEPFDAARIEVEYSLTGPCRDVQAYYAQLTTNAGWHVEPLQSFGAGNSSSLFDSAYTHVEGYLVTLDIDCYIHQTYSGGYTLTMRAQ